MNDFNLKWPVLCKHQAYGVDVAFRNSRPVWPYQVAESMGEKVKKINESANKTDKVTLNWELVTSSDLCNCPPLEARQCQTMAQLFISINYGSLAKNEKKRQRSFVRFFKIGLSTARLGSTRNINQIHFFISSEWEKSTGFSQYKICVCVMAKILPAASGRRNSTLLL